MCKEKIACWKILAENENLKNYQIKYLMKIWKVQDQGVSLVRFGESLLSEADDHLLTKSSQGLTSVHAGGERKREIASYKVTNSIMSVPPL